MHFVTWFLKDMGSIGSSAAKEIDDRRMKRRMMLVKVVALMIRWQSFRNLKWLKDILLKITMLKILVNIYNIYICKSKSGTIGYVTVVN